MLFEGKSICEPKQRKIVSSEHKNKHVLENPNRLDVYQYHIDGGIIPVGTQERRCDYLVEVIVPKKTSIYLVELKGSDIKKALLQIEAVICKYSLIQSYTVYPRIIANKVTTHKIKDSCIRQFQKNYPNTIITEKEYVDIV